MSHQLRSYLHSIHLSARERGSALPPGLAIGERIFGKRDLNPILASPSNLIGSAGAFVFCSWENDVSGEGGQDHYGIMRCGI